MATMKKPKALIDAEKAEQDKAREISETKEKLRLLEKEWAILLQNLRVQRIAADASLPQCNRVYLHSRTGVAESGPAQVVILRQTKTGTLVVRDVGEPERSEYKYKWIERRGEFVEDIKRDWFHKVFVLRDVPEKYVAYAKSCSAP